MKKLFVILLFSLNALASDGPAFLATTAALSSNIGYTVQAGTPLFFQDRWSVQVQYFNMPNFNFIEAGLLVLIYKDEPIRLGFKTMLEFFLDEVRSRGIHYSFAGEYILARSFSINLESGFSIGFNSYGTGLTFIVGPKFYFY